jgi:gluconolactonase
VLIALEDVEEFASGLDHSEGICVAPDGTVYASGEDGQLYRFGADGSVDELLRVGGMALGIAATGDGEILMCSVPRRAVLRIDPVRRTWSTYSMGTAERPMVQPNWGCFAPDGTYYVSDSGGWQKDDGAIYRISPDGTTEVWTTECAGFPNGTALSPDGAELYVLESTTPALAAVPIARDGGAGPRRVVAELPGTVPDGVALTDDGRFVVACYRPDTVLVVSPDGSSEELVGDPLGTVIAAPTNVAFAGADLADMLVPNLGRWHISRFRHPGIRGVPLNYPVLPPTESRPS